MARRIVTAREQTEMLSPWRVAATYWHITDNPDFKPDPHHSPELNTTMGGELKPGLFLTRDPEHWMQGYGYYRPYVSEIDAPDDIGEGSHLSPERYVPADQYNRITVKRTIPIDAYTREHWGESGPVESSYGEDFETGEKFTDKPFGGLDLYKKTPGYKYPGTVMDRPEEWRKSYEQKVHDYQKRTPGIIARQRTATPWHSREGDPTYSIPTPELKRYRQFNPSIETPQDMHDSLWTRNWGRGLTDRPEYRRWKNDNFSSGGGDEGGTEEEMVEGFESGAHFPPVEITTNGHGAILSDGNHRVNTADLLSHPALDSYIHYDPHQYDDRDMVDDVDPDSELGRHITRLVQNHPYKALGDEAPITRHVFRRHPETGEWQRGKVDPFGMRYIDSPDYMKKTVQEVPGFRDQGLGYYDSVDWGNGPEDTNRKFLYAKAGGVW